jgi:ankyrin repeat protein
MLISDFTETYLFFKVYTIHTINNKILTIMKKIILTILCISAFTMVNANSTTVIKKANLEVSSTYETNSFCKLIQMGNYEAVEALIESGQDVNQKSGELTPLMFAARHNKVKIAKLLIEKGAKLKTKTRKRLTALDWAKQSKSDGVYKVIEEALKKAKAKK